MTFTEAAAQVLRLVGKPLHYKEITDVAIEKNLLSHVGKSPEVTMGARLAALVKKGEKDNPLVRVKPGVFALRDWDKATIDKGLADRTPALERLKALAEAAGAGEEGDADAAEPEAEPASEVEHVSQVTSSAAEVAADDDDDEDKAPTAAELERAKMAAGATDLFAPEEDDDEPIFGSDDEDEDNDDTARARGKDRGDGSRRRRRRRRRGGRGGEDSGDDLPTYTVSDAPADTASAGGEERPERDRSERDRSDRDRSDRDRSDRDRSDRDRSDRSDRGRSERGRDRRPDKALDELAGAGLAQAIESLLGTLDKNGGTVGIQKIAETAQKKGLLSADISTAQAMISAAVVADNQRKDRAGERPRFRVVGNRVGLSDWMFDGELIRLERDVLTAAGRYRESARRALLKRITDLPHRSVGELVMLLLEQLGLSHLEVVRRPGIPGPELHLSARATGPAGDIPTAVVIRRDGREVGRERVTELRGALHHYGPAAAGWIITTGQVLSGAREEAGVPGAAPVSLLDGAALAALCEQHGVGVAATRVRLPLPDADFFESLRNA